MLACTSWHYSPFAEAGPHNYDCSSSGPFAWNLGLQEPEQLREISPSSPSSLSSAGTPVSMAQLSPASVKCEGEHQPSNSQISEECTRLHVNHEQHDSGLGIITQEDIYGNAFYSTATVQGNRPAYVTPEQNSDIHHHRQISSPFEERIYAPIPVWTHGYPQTTMSDASSSTFASTPAQQFLSPQIVYPSIQYSMSPATYTPSIQHCPPWQYNQLRGPTIRHDSMPSIIKQERPGLQLTPAQMGQWTPQSSEMCWQNATCLTPVAMQPVTTMDQHMSQGEDWYYQTSDSTPSARTAMTVPLRRKPHLRPSLSESCVPRISSPARLRAATTGHFLQPPQYEHGGETIQQQLPLPPLPPSVLINTPMVMSSHVVHSDSPRLRHRPSRSTSSTPNRRKRPISPPASDFAQNNVPYLIPVRQDPAFQGDLYTPKYKRRTPNGRWEGWCGYCPGGRWLDLKNSRYWEDKLRNHGICAKTKMKFAEPIEIRRVNPDGSVVVKTEVGVDPNDPFADQKKREGLCGTCGVWIHMDGLRTKARDRAVGWWMHAYKVSEVLNLMIRY